MFIHETTQIKGPNYISRIYLYFMFIQLVKK